MMESKAVSDDLKRMTREDAPRIKETEANPELDLLIETEFKGFQRRFKALAKQYGEEKATDAFMEEEFDFNADLDETLERWIRILPKDSVFHRGCVYALECLKLLLDKIEELRPEEA